MGLNNEVMTFYTHFIMVRTFPCVICLSVGRIWTQRDMPGKMCRMTIKYVWNVTLKRQNSLQIGIWGRQHTAKLYAKYNVWCNLKEECNTCTALSLQQIT